MLKSARSFTDNNYEPMQRDQTREFEIDSEKENCRLLDKKIKKIKITKLQERKDEFMFRMEDIPQIVAKALVECKGGYVPWLLVNDDAEQCGIGKMLMLLCLNEKEIHNTIISNRALKRIKGYSEQNIPKAREIEEWVLSKCEKIVGLTMSPSRLEAAHVYFNSALESGFTEMFIAPSLSPSSKFYPEEGPCSVKALKDRYTDDGYMKDDEGTDINRMVWNNKVQVTGRNWFFCRPKIPTLHVKCTAL